MCTFVGYTTVRFSAHHLYCHDSMGTFIVKSLVISLQLKLMVSLCLSFPVNGLAFLGVYMHYFPPLFMRSCYMLMVWLVLVSTCTTCLMCSTHTLRYFPDEEQGALAITRRLEIQQGKGQQPLCIKSVDDAVETISSGKVTKVYACTILYSYFQGCKFT